MALIEYKPNYAGLDTQRSMKHCISLNPMRDINYQTPDVLMILISMWLF